MRYLLLAKHIGKSKMRNAKWLQLLGISNLNDERTSNG